MNTRINPFQPSSPTPRGMFTGRYNEILSIERALFQTKSGQGQSFLLLGERGIGKTSLLNYVRICCEGLIEVRSQKLNFLVLEIDITKDTSQQAMIRKIELAIRRRLSNSEPAREAFQRIWNFMKKFEVAGVAYKEEQKEDRELLFDEFTYSLADTIRRITKDDESSLFDSRFDGILIIIDEADNANSTLELGAFIKLTQERLQKEGVGRLLFGVAGLPKTRDILFESHPSSLRLFEEMTLDRLSPEEVGHVVGLAMKRAEELNGLRTEITPAAQTLLVNFADGFPHFIQQYGFSAFDESNGETITEDDVMRGAYAENGALEAIGNKYYRQDFYKKIKGDSYRQVLSIMAESLDGWVSKKTIREGFSGSDAVLTNAINALISRNIILPKEGARGVYRLRDKGFAVWIKRSTNPALSGGNQEIQS